MAVLKRLLKPQFLNAYLEAACRHRRRSRAVVRVERRRLPGGRRDRSR